jgi:pyrimidine-nucleoside phosphorylase
MNNYQTIIKMFTKVNDNESMNNLIEYFERPDIASEEIADLAVVLANSGKKTQIDDIVADIPSTGGPSSLTTILCPLYLQTIGLNVLKLGVSGRPAGGIDVLSCIPGYRVNFSVEQIIDLNQKGAKYIHFLASNEFAPLDAILFSYRKRVGKIGVPNLAIASLLSKKLALGVNVVGLDVRVSDFGNFGSTFSIAKENARKFCETAKILGIKAVCFLSDATYPYQPYIGRGEALIALSDVFYSSSESLLEDHNQFCHKLAAETAQLAGLIDNINCRSKLLQVFSENLEYQGSSLESFLKYVERIQISDRTSIYSCEEGIVEIDLNKIREILVFIQNKYESTNGDFSDSCGIIIECNSGDFVYKNQPIYSVRCESEYQKFMVYELAKSYKVKKGYKFFEESRREEVVYG